MKTLFQIICITFFTTASIAQSEPPAPPQTPISSDSGNSSVSTSKSNNNLRFKAKWSNKSRYEKLKLFLIDQLGEDGLTVNNNTYQWSKESDAFNCKLTNKAMNLSLDYTQASKSLINQVDNMMENLKYASSNGNPENDIKRAQKEIEKAQKEIEKAKQKIKRAKRELELKQKSKNFEERKEQLEKRREHVIKERKEVRAEIIEKRKKILEKRREAVEELKNKKL